MKKKICFIINPISGIAKQKISESFIKELIDPAQAEIEISYTKAPKHATELAKDACARGIDIVVAVGGDGSINEVSKGMLYSQSSMAIIPTGSGNGLARNLGIPMNLKESIQLILKAQTKTIDTCEINGIHFINVAGIGFDAEIAHRFASFGKRGFLSYIKLVLNCYFSFKEEKFTLFQADKKFNKSALMLSIANGSQFGNNASISPLSQLDDGLFEVCFLNKIPLFAIPKFVSQLFSKKINASKYFEQHSVKELHFIAESGKIHVDGEPLITEKEMHVLLKHASIHILVP
jgi:diacylglycerol kinase (ATP)